MVRLFSNREFALIDWEKGIADQGPAGHGKVPCNAWSPPSSDATQRHSLALGWKDKPDIRPISKFREPVLAAAAELERLGIIAGARPERSTHGKEQDRMDAAVISGATDQPRPSSDEDAAAAVNTLPRRFTVSAGSAFA